MVGLAPCVGFDPVCRFRIALALALALAGRAASQGRLRFGRQIVGASSHVLDCLERDIDGFRSLVGSKAPKTIHHVDKIRGTDHVKVL